MGPVLQAAPQRQRRYNVVREPSALARRHGVDLKTVAQAEDRGTSGRRAAVSSMCRPTRRNPLHGGADR
jgi:hypothetical protein